MSLHYTVHDPQTGMKVSRHDTLEEALAAAHEFLPLHPGTYHSPGKCLKHPPAQCVSVQEWDENYEPLRLFRLSGKMPGKD